MNAFHDQAIILRRVKHLDNDFKLTVLLRQTGKVFVIAKGVQKPSSKLKAIVEPYIEADVHVMLPQNGVNGRLINGRVINSHPQIRSWLPAFSAASQCAELVQEILPNRVPSEGVYDILRSAFRTLNQRESAPVAWIGFVSTLLFHLGHGDITPELRGQPLVQCLALINQKIEQHLQQRLKSEVLQIHDVSRTHFFA